MLIGSCAIGLCAGGGFCAGSEVVVKHQRINGLSFVFSASMPALLAVGGSEAINLLRSTPSVLEALQDNIQMARSILDRLDIITIPSHVASPIIHIYIKTRSAPLLEPSSAGARSAKISNPNSPKARDEVKYEIDGEEALLQEVVEEALNQGVMITKAKRLRGQEVTEGRPSIRLAITSALSKKETENSIRVVKNALVKVLGKRR
jgi:serine palmitoyltransferase